MNKSGLYYPELDSLRFFAFLLVLVHHSPYLDSIVIWRTLSEYGWLGVDLFLCLSAFLFARLLYIEYQEKGNINVGYFYVRRALRIWPLYFFFFGIMLILTIHEKGWDTTLTQRTIGVLTFTDNLFSANSTYNMAILYSAHMWTISYEEQFYLVVPWVLRKFYQLKSSSVAYLLLVAFLVGSLVRAIFIYTGASHPVIWVLPVTHFESIFGGLMVGLGMFDRPLKKVPGWILFLSGVFALYAVTLLPNVDEMGWHLMLTYPLIGIGNTLLLFSVMRGNVWPLSLFLKNRELGYLGKISYGLYVYHALGIHLAYQLTDAYVSTERQLVYPATGLLLSLVVTVGIAMVSYQFLEKPFLRLKERFTFITSRPV
jgi:peptidoglycan/LPS O-acetylase OafA/YrhL